jgi:hypothetical protein
MVPNRMSYLSYPKYFHCTRESCWSCIAMSWQGWMSQIELMMETCWQVSFLMWYGILCGPGFSGERTFGVLTKLDLMDKGTNALDVSPLPSLVSCHIWMLQTDLESCGCSFWNLPWMHEHNCSHGLVGTFLITCSTFRFFCFLEGESAENVKYS